MPKLVLPSAEYKKSFLEDFLTREEMQDEYSLTGISKQQVPKNFKLFLKKLRQQEKGIYPVKGLVPQTVFWLVDGKKFIGKTGIRHKLNHHLKTVGGHIGYYIRPTERQKGYGKIILKLALRKAKALGIKDAVVTCDITNLGSKKIIESNGGRLMAKVKMGKRLPDKLRYRIKLS